MNDQKSTPAHRRKKKRIRPFTKQDEIRLTQSQKGLRKSMDMTNQLRKDRVWMVEEIRRLRGILAENEIEYEHRVLRTQKEIEDGNERFSDDDDDD